MVSSNTARALLARHGDCAAQETSRWPGAIALPEPVGRFYAEVGPLDVTVEGFGNSTYFPSLAGLWTFQAGYRWNDVSHELIDDWPDQWIVVASNGGDPFAFDALTERVLFVRHGRGDWGGAHEIAQDLNTMAAGVATLGLVAREAEELLDDLTFEVKPQHKATARQRLLHVLGDARPVDLLLDLMGWS